MGIINIKIILIGGSVMPRVARQKTYESIYHVICKSISEIDLFKSDEDKIKYIEFIKKYQDIHKFEVYCYCIMKNHIHLIMDVRGADISKIMHGINFSYAQYFNKKHERKGHLFQDRFRSKIIDSDRYLIVASAYIHNNPAKIRGYKQSPENYAFSSLATFLGLRNDPYGLVSDNFVMRFFSSESYLSRKTYYRFVLKSNKEIVDDIEFVNEGTQYSSQRVIINRNIKPEKIIEYLSSKTNLGKDLFQVKGNHKITDVKALLVLMLKCFCNYNTSLICKLLGNITQSNVSRLVNKGVNLIKSNEKYRLMVNEFCYE